jgi:two-component system, NtrC family, nitrogen regulation sensor histidine kinase NtrY
MVFKNFRFQIIIRVLLLTATVGLLTWCIVNELYLRSGYIAVGVVLFVVELIWYVDSFNRDIKTFMLALLQQDFTTYYQRQGKGKSFEELYDTLNEITGVFRRISSEKEIQHRYLEMLVEHLRVGIISFSADGKVHIVNQALKNLLRKEVMTNLKSLESVDKSLVQTLKEIRTGETKLIKLQVEGESLNLSIHASELKLEAADHKIISLQNIRSELDANEIEAWQKLIRVLTHEIMNSVAPITSLSATLHGLIQQHRSSFGNTLYDSLNQGLEAIMIRSEGLHSFTQAYRKLTRIPEPNIERTNLKQALERVCQLLSVSIQGRNIRLALSGISAEVMVDPQLIEHVLINIVQNAIEAVSGSDDPTININLEKTSEAVRVMISDNGPGIEPSTLDKIFIPFFTTKHNGSGIGLAVSKQILQMHNAQIRVNSKVGVGTQFIIAFQYVDAPL